MSLTPNPPGLRTAGLVILGPLPLTGLSRARCSNMTPYRYAAGGIIQPALLQNLSTLLKVNKKVLFFTKV